MNKCKNKNRMKRAGSGKWEKAVSWILIVAMLLSIAGIMGCGTAQGDKGPGEGGENIESSKGTEERGDKEDTGEKTEDADNGKVMGRYLEHSNEALKGQLDTGSRIACMDDGKLAIMSGNAGKWVSADGGATWEKEKMPCLGMGILR